MNPLEGRPIKEDKLPASLFLLNRCPCQHESVVRAEATVSPKTEQSALLSHMFLRVLCVCSVNLNLKCSLHGEVIREAGRHIHRLPEAADVPHLQRVVS